MTSDDFVKIERELGCKLSESFKAFMLHYPEELLAARVEMETLDGEIYSEGPADLELRSSADDIIAMNKYDPDQGWYDMKPPNWPATFLVIGTNGCGEVFGVDLAVENSPVYSGGPHDGYDDPADDIPRTARSLEQFAKRLIKQYRDL